MMTEKTKRLTLTFTIPLLVLYGFFIFWIPSWRDHDVSLATGIYTSLLSIFGPWSTYIMKFTSLPHTGELWSPQFNLIALGHTAGLIAVISISISTNKKWLTAFCVGLYFLLIFIWMWLGLMMMASCLT